MTDSERRNEPEECIALCWIFPQRANHVTGQQIHPQIFLDHLRSLAAQHLHAQGGLDIADIPLEVPAARFPRQAVAA